jgi:iturin family lipopeptide synthetase A
VSCVDFPLTPSGEIDRSALHGQGAPARHEPARRPPRDRAEEVVAGIWADLLGIDGPVGVTENFFSVGGYSLLASRFVMRVRESFGIDLPLAGFFADPTVSGVVGALRGDPAHGSEVDRRAEVLLKVAVMSEQEVRDLTVGTRTRTGEQ